MSDPAIEAAHRAGGGWYSAREMEAAREALKPIRELHRVERGEYEDECYCVECGNHWPCATAKLIYSSEELER